MAIQTERMPPADPVVISPAAETGVLNQVISVIQAKSDFPVTVDATLESLGLDSISLAEITLDLEQKFNIQADEALLDANSVAEVASYVETARRKLAAK